MKKYIPKKRLLKRVRQREYAGLSWGVSWDHHVCLLFILHHSEQTTVIGGLRERNWLREKKIIEHSRTSRVQVRSGRNGDRYDARWFEPQVLKFVNHPLAHSSLPESAVLPSAATPWRAFIYFHAVRMPHVFSAFPDSRARIGDEAEQGWERRAVGEGLRKVARKTRGTFAQGNGSLASRARVVKSAGETRNP